MNIFEQNRVYMNMSRDFSLKTPFDFDKALLEYAKSKEIDKYRRVLYEKNGSFYRGRTIAALVDDSNRFIGQLGVVSSEEDMASFTSKRQIRFLGKALAGNRKRVSGFAMIILHCMFMSVKSSQNPNYTVLSQCATAIHELVSAYYDEYPDDEIARFFLECYSEVLEELNDHRMCKSLKDFPDIPKNDVEEATE